MRSRLIVALLVALPCVARAQGYATDFDEASDWDWHVTGLWNVDGTPSTAANGIYRSAPSSLNYNNRNGNYITGGANNGNAYSPLINLRHMTSPTLTFWCRYHCDTWNSYGLDRRSLYVLSPAGTILRSYSMYGTGATSGIGNCGASSTWHQHTVALDPTLGIVKLRFYFYGQGILTGSWTGWSIDDLKVAPLVSPPTPKTSAYATPFADAIGWALSGMWGVDGTGAYAPVSGTTSLNFNNGVDYAGSAYGEARSPLVDTSFLQAPSFTFRCNYQTETTGTVKDQRRVEVQDASGAVLASYQLAGVGATAGVGSCAAMGTWHTHRVTLNGAWREVRLVFRFDSVDSLSNQYAGWFVDDLSFDLPDLKPVRKDMAQDLRFEVVNGRRYLRYTESVGNAGFAPVTALGPVAAFRRFLIKNMSGTTLMGVDTQVGSFASEFLVRKNAPAGLPDFGPIGAIQPGYGDTTFVNENSLYNWLDTLSFPDGDYILEHSWDPLGGVPESDETNNAGTKLVVRIQGNTISVVNSMNP